MIERGDNTCNQMTAFLWDIETPVTSFLYPSSMVGVCGAGEYHSLRGLALQLSLSASTFSPQVGHLIALMISYSCCLLKETCLICIITVLWP